MRKVWAGQAGEVRLDKQRSGEETFALGSAFSTYPKTTKQILEMITSSNELIYLDFVCLDAINAISRTASFVCAF